MAPSIFFRIPQNFLKNVGLNELYKYSKFERNRNTRRLFLCDLNIFVILCKGEEEKCEENQAMLGINI